MDHVPTLNAGDGRTAILHAHMRAGGFLLTHKSYTCEFDQPWHEHPIASVDFVIEGGGMGHYNRGEAIPAAAGDIGFYPAEIRHKYKSASLGTRSLHLIFFQDALQEDALRDPALCSLRSPRSLELALGLLRQLHEPDVSSALDLEGAALEMLSELERAHRYRRTDHRAVRCAMLHLDSVLDRSLGLAELAEEVGLSRGQLARAFRDRLGITPGEYHRRTRVRVAAERVIASQEPLSRIAFETGFSDQAHLTRQFRLSFSDSPARLRALIDRTRVRAVAS